MKNKNTCRDEDQDSGSKTSRAFYENPYDINTFFEALSIAAKNEKEYIFMDRFLTHMRLDPLQEISTVAFNVLTKDLELVKFESN